MDSKDIPLQSYSIQCEKQRPGYAYHFKIYPEARKFVKVIDELVGDHKIRPALSFSIDIVNVLYYREPNTLGPIGYAGPCSFPSFYDRKTLTLRIQFTNVPLLWARAMAPKFEALSYSPPLNEKYRPALFISPKTTWPQDLLRGMYKKPFFDEVFGMLQKHFPSLKQVAFAFLSSDSFYEVLGEPRKKKKEKETKREEKSGGWSLGFRINTGRLSPQQDGS